MLTEGDIEDLGKSIPESGGFCARCPKHRSKFSGGLYFSLSTGQAVTKAPCSAKQYNPNWKLATYQVSIKNDQVYVDTSPVNGAEPTEDLDSKFWARLTLAKIEKYNHDSFIFAFTLDDYLKIEYLIAPDKKEFKRLVKARAKLIKKLGQNPFECWHIDIQDYEGKNIIREYTPISTWKDLQQSSKLDLLIKLYPDGQMSQILAKAQVGAKLFMGPPKQTIPAPYFQVSDNVTYACIAGGTGITPFIQMLQFIETKLNAGEKPFNLTLIYSNKKAEDVLCKEQLHALLKKYPDHIKVIFTLTREDPKSFDESQGYQFGRVSGDMIEKYIPPTTHQHVFVSDPKVCGAPSSPS